MIMRRTLYFLLITFSLSSGNLLEDSQTLWSKFLNGGIANIGSLDPLRIPLVKVDQSHGHTTYRMILTNVDIRGLNASTLESIQIARGSVKSNLTEREAGFISYNDRNIVDSIRYRFHVASKDPKTSTQTSENLEVESIEKFEDASSRRRQSEDDIPSRRASYTNQEQNGAQMFNKQNQQTMYRQRYQQYRNDQYQNQEYPESQRQLSGNQQDNFNYQSNYRRQQDYNVKPTNNGQSTATPYNRNQVFKDRNQEYPETQRQFNGNQQDNRNYQSNYRQQQDYNVKSTNTRQSTPLPYTRNQEFKDRNIDSVYVQRQMNINNRRRFDENEEFMVKEDPRTTKETMDVSIKTQPQRFTFNRESEMTFRSNAKPCVYYEQFTARNEDQPGFVDIVYADDQNKEMRHFGNLRIEENRNKTVYSIEDLLKDLETHRKFIIHNFTEGESLSKKNDPARTAQESKRIDDLIRYAREFQEKQGYFEEGMELRYHYGNDNDSKVFNGKRTKRAHAEEVDNEDDIIHMMMKIRVPLLSVKATYTLMGEVEKQVLRGNGQLKGNFTDLTALFTMELKKIGPSAMMVRATRAKLETESENIILQGMDENGPVKEILTQGLMAAEAVAAMLVDDLTTKALNETASDAMVYKMYKELPNN